MNFNSNYLETYKNLLETTELQLGYQEFIKLFRFLRVGLEKRITGLFFLVISLRIIWILPIFN